MYMYIGHDEGVGQFITRDWYVLWSEYLITWHWAKSLRREDAYLPNDSVSCRVCDCVQSP